MGVTGARASRRRRGARSWSSAPRPSPTCRSASGSASRPASRPPRSPPTPTASSSARRWSRCLTDAADEAAGLESLRDAGRGARGRRPERPLRMRLLPNPVHRDLLALVLRLVLGGVVLVAGALKVGQLETSARSVRAYQLLPYDVAGGSRLRPARARARRRGAADPGAVHPGVRGHRGAADGRRSSSASPRPGLAACRSTAAVSARGEPSRASQTQYPRRSPATSGCSPAPCGSPCGRARR